MAIVALLESRRKGRASWVAVRDRRRLLLRGMVAGDEIRIVFRDAEGRETEINYIGAADGGLRVISGSVAVRVEHLKTSGNPVTVELI